MSTYLNYIAWVEKEAEKRYQRDLLRLEATLYPKDRKLRYLRNKAKRVWK